MTRVDGTVGIGPGWPPTRAGRDLNISVRAPYRTTIDGTVVEPVFAPIRVSSSGKFSVTLEPGFWLWLIQHGSYKSVRALEVPDTETADYEELIEVDPGTLVPLDPIPPNAQDILDTAEQAAIDAADAAAAAEAAAELFAPGEAGGTATLDEAAKLPEVQVPERLSEASLSATNAAGKGVFAVLRSRLASGLSCSFSVLGDSTGNGANEWPRLLANHIGAAYPAHTVRVWTWDDATQSYPQPTVAQLGAAGRAKVTRGSGGGSLAWYAPSGMSDDLDIRINLKAVDWGNGGVQTLVARQGSSGLYSFKFALNSIGLMTLAWSSDGTTYNPTVFGGSVPFADGTEGWLRVTLDADNGAAGRDVKFYSSVNGTTWTQVGSTSTTAGVTTVFKPNYQFEFGDRAGGEPLVTGSEVYEVQIRDGINGPLVCPPNPAAWLRPTTSGGGFTGTISGAPVLDVFNGSHPGASLAYLGDATRLPKLLPLADPALVLLSDSHNESPTAGPPFMSNYSAWVTSIKARHVGVPLGIMTQNPQIAPATYGPAQERRRTDLFAVGASLGATVFDSYGAFTSHPGGVASLMESDGVHPNPAGSIVWAGVVTPVFDATL